MSSTTDSTVTSGWGDRTESTITLNSITSGALIALAHGGPSGAHVARVSHTVTTAATSQDPIGMSWEASSTSADTVSIRFTVPQGGDMSGAKGAVYVEFKDAAGGGLSVPS